MVRDNSVYCFHFKPLCLSIFRQDLRLVCTALRTSGCCPLSSLPKPIATVSLATACASLQSNGPDRNSDGFFYLTIPSVNILAIFDEKSISDLFYFLRFGPVIRDADGDACLNIFTSGNRVQLYNWLFRSLALSWLLFFILLLYNRDTLSYYRSVLIHLSLPMTL